MNKEAADYLKKARALLREAEKVLSLDLFNAAGRAAYLAAFHASQALIADRTSRSIKTHNGVRTAFQDLTRDDPRLPAELRSFLAKGYNLKAVADYETGPGSEVSKSKATEALVVAERFVTYFENVLANRAS